MNPNSIFIIIESSFRKLGSDKEPSMHVHFLDDHKIYDDVYADSRPAPCGLKTRVQTRSSWLAVVEKEKGTVVLVSTCKWGSKLSNDESDCRALLVASSRKLVAQLPKPQPFDEKSSDRSTNYEIVFTTMNWKKWKCYFDWPIRWKHWDLFSRQKTNK